MQSIAGAVGGLPGAREVLVRRADDTKKSELLPRHLSMETERRVDSPVGAKVVENVDS